MSIIALDYETFYSESKKNRYTISDLGNWRYCNDERFDPFLLSVHDGSNSWVGHPKDFNWGAIAPNDLLVAHNASFDSAVTRRLAELGRAPALTNKWQCTANMSSFLSGTRALQHAMWVLEKQKLKKEARDYMDGKHWSDVVKDGQDKVCADYCQGDTIACWGLYNKYQSQWPQLEHDLSSLTLKQCARGVGINVDLLNEYIEKLQVVIFNLIDSFPWTTRGNKPTSPIGIAEQCRIDGIPCPPLKKEDEEGYDQWEKDWGIQFPWVMGACQVRSLNKLLTSLQTIKERLRPDNTIDFSLLYFGAHTGRWSGGGSGLNLQNLKKVPLFLKNMHMVIPPVNVTYKEFKLWVDTCTDYTLDIRRILVARPGKKFILADLSQIEPRVLAWLVGNKQLLTMLQSGMNIYEAFARVSMGWTGGKLKDEAPDKYQLAKIQILGLGYGCGWEKFITIAAGYFVTLTPDQSKKLVWDFRASNPLIAGRGPAFNDSREDEPIGMWKKLDDAFKQSVGSDFEMGLPSGRVMKYRDVRRGVKKKKNAEGKLESRFIYIASVGETRKELYGGLLTENIVQAIARDVFGEHLLSLEKQTGDVIFHVHDEAITEVDLDVTPRDVEQIMAVTPNWSPGLPVASEAKEATHYLK